MCKSHPWGGGEAGLSAGVHGHHSVQKLLSQPQGPRAERTEVRSPLLPLSVPLLALLKFVNSRGKREGVAENF